MFYLCFLFGPFLARKLHIICVQRFLSTRQWPIPLHWPIQLTYKLDLFCGVVFFDPFFHEIVQTYVLPYGMNKAHQSTSHHFYLVMLYSNGHFRNMFIYLKITIVCGGGRTCVFITITCHPRSIPTQAQEKILYLYSSSLIFSSLAARCAPFQLL